jgi:hypothetical protein
MRRIRLEILAEIVLTLFGAVTLFGQEKPRDIDGWDKVRWGMTLEEVRSAYGVESQPERQDEWTVLQLHSVKMAGVEMGVQVGARRDADKVSSVRLWSYFGLPNSAPSAGPQDFDTLRIMLSAKYGRPDDEQVKRGENTHLIKTVLWKFPSTSILLSLEQSASLPNLGTIYLDFTATAK